MFKFCMQSDRRWKIGEAVFKNAQKQIQERHEDVKLERNVREIVLQANKVLEKKNQQLKEDMMMMVRDKQEVHNALTSGSVVTNAVTCEGEIDGHKVQIHGHVKRPGHRFDNPNGPCMHCVAVIELGSTALMARYGTRCQYAG